MNATHTTHDAEIFKAFKDKPLTVAQAAKAAKIDEDEAESGLASMVTRQYATVERDEDKPERSTYQLTPLGREQLGLRFP